MKRCRKYKFDNRGAALVMAIVVIAFITILTTILLYLANMNYQMKATDYNTKVSFYGAEIPLEGIRTALVKDVSEAAEIAYADTILLYSNLSADERTVHYETIFYDTLIKKWESSTDDPATPAVDKWEWVYGINSYGLQYVPYVQSDCHVIKSSGSWAETLDCTDLTCTKPYHIILDHTITDATRMQKEIVPGSVPAKSRVMLNGIKVVYTENDFTSVIQTNFCIAPPNINWEVDECDDTYVAGDEIEREDIKFETYVTYMGYKKQ